MSSISSGIGLVSGIDLAGLADALISIQRGAVRRLEDRSAGLQATQSGVKTLEANLLTIAGSAQQLTNATTFDSLTLQNSDPAQLNVTTGNSTEPGTYHLQSVRLASTQQLRSKGFANADQQLVGAGTLTIATSGQIQSSTLLDALNGGNGIRRGKVQITDRSGSSAAIDLSNTYTVDDVLNSINGNTQIAVTASTLNGQLVLTDTSGASVSDLVVTDLNGGNTALDLGIRKNASSSSLTGDTVYSLTDDFTLDQINDGNGLFRLNGAPDIRVTLTDDTVLDVNLDSAATIADIVDLINNHADNGGKLLASRSGNHLELTDQSGGGGSSSFAAEDINGSAVVNALGLDVAATGGTITGDRLLAGLNSVLLRNLRGGQGIDQLGSLSLTDRTGTTATVDLSAAGSLDEVVSAINAAESSGGTKLQLTARINGSGTGFEVLDTSGATAGNLTISDVGGSTLATQLGIAIDAAATSVDSGALNQRGVNAATSIDDYAPDGGDIDVGSILIVDSAGNQQSVSISSGVHTIGDVLLRINSANDVSVRAELNGSGDGFALIDEAGGSGVLRVEEIGGKTAADLRLLGDAVLNTSGKYEISSRRQTVVEIAATDTLNDVAEKLNAASGKFTASVINDSSAFNSFRLSLTSNDSGTAGNLIVDSGGLNLGLTTLSTGQDALLRVGQDADTGFLVASSDNSFADVASGLNVTLLAPSASTAAIQVSRDTGRATGAIQGFVDGYNAFINSTNDLTKYDAETQERGVLQGQGIVFRATGRLDSLVNRRLFGSDQTVQSLGNLGIRVGTGGKLILDRERLDAALTSDPQAVADFFLDADKGFGGQLKSTVESLTDPRTGSFALESNSLQQSVESLNDRITQLDALLETRRDRLMRQFINMESILGTLSSQQEAISGISLLKVGKTKTSA